MKDHRNRIECIGCTGNHDCAVTRFFFVLFTWEYLSPVAHLIGMVNLERDDLYDTFKWFYKRLNLPHMKVCDYYGEHKKYGFLFRCSDGCDVLMHFACKIKLIHWVNFEFVTPLAEFMAELEKLINGNEVEMMTWPTPRQTICHKVKYRC